MHYIQRLLFVLFLFPASTYAQIDCVIDDPGDIAFVGYENRGSSSYAFVFLDSCPPNTAIIFDDENWLGTDWETITSEGANTWTNTTGNTLAPGTVITILNGNDSGSNPIFASLGTVTESDAGFDLANNDGLFAYVGTFRSPTVDFLAFAGDDNAPAPQTLSGTGLVAGQTAINTESLGTTDEGVLFSMVDCKGTLTDCLQMINAPDNWEIIGTNGTTFPGSIPTSIEVCLVSEITTINVNPSTVCSGVKSTISITGKLNGATEWAIYTGSCGGTKIGTTTSNVFDVNPTTTTTYYIRGESTCLGTKAGTCQTKTINVTEVSVAVAGADQEKCNTASFTMAATVPTNGTGKWSINSGSATITDENSTTTSVTVAAGNTAELKWTVSNGTCTDSEDLVKLTNHATPSTAAAGDDQEKCNTASFTMVATAPTSGTGKWSINSGSATITDENSTTTSVTVAAGNMAELKWTVSNGGCTDTEDLVKLTNHATPSTAAAGDDQEKCNTSSFTMAATAPTTGTGKWTINSGTATITDENSATTTVTVTAGNMAELKWTVSNGTCTDNEDLVKLSNHNNPTAGIMVTETSETPNDNTVCIGDKATLTASGGTSYTWNNDASLSATNIAAPLATPTSMTTYMVTVTDDNNCTATASTTINVRIKNLAGTDTKNHELDATDPCSCGDPLNKRVGDKTLFHDILTVTSTPGRSIWISDADGQFKDANNNLIPSGTLPVIDKGGNAGGTGTGTLVPETSTPGVYQLDFYHFENIATTFTYTDGFTSESFTSSKCNSCIVIPTMNEWGLFIFGLLLLNLGVGLIYKKDRIDFI